MKQIYHILAVVLFVTGAVLTSCNKVETTPENNPELTSEAQTIQFTATLAAKGEDPQSKAITTGKDGENKEILNVAWAAGEEIAVYYQKDDDSYATTTATVGTPNGDGSAPITATLSSPKDGGTVKFVFPATLHNGTGDIDASKLRNKQVGTLADISANFDAATGSGTLSTAAGTAVVSDMVTLTNRVCICKFSFSYQKIDGSALTLSNFYGLRICSPNGAYNVTTTTKGDIYVALLPSINALFTFIADATTDDGLMGGRSYCMSSSTGVTLAAGKFYRNLPVTLKRQQNNDLKDLSEGSITASNYDIIYQSNTSATTNTITIPDRINVTLAGVNISASGSAGIICSGSANITLNGSNRVTTTADYYPGILAGGSGTTLTISGSGSLTATGAHQGAGIGSGSPNSSHSTCGNIVINSGTINVTGGDEGPGIGSGKDGTCGNITIQGGTITANGGYYGAGIGSGAGMSALENNSICGDIIINGGTINATGGMYAAGIGGGDFAKFASITIGSGIISVTAKRNYDSGNQVPIGKGDVDKGSGSVTIDGTTSWTAGTATTNLNFVVSTTTFENDTWTLTHK